MPQKTISKRRQKRVAGLKKHKEQERQKKIKKKAKKMVKLPKKKK